MKYHSGNDKTEKAMEKSKTQQFLNHYLEAKSKSTYKSYKRGIALFEEYYDKDADTILEERRQDIASGDFQRNKRFSRELEKFHKWMLDKDYSINSARTNTLGILQLFRYYGMPIADVIFKTVITTKTFIPNIEQLRRMFQIADLRAKVILSLGLDLSWRISDFIKLEKEDIPDFEQQTPIPFEKITQKEKVISSTFISTETIQLLKAYIPTLPKENPYLLPSNRTKHLDDESVNKILKKLLRKAKIKIPKNKRFTFHSLRKRFLSTCYNNNVESDIAKLLVGKSIGKSMETYLGDVKLKNAFITVREQALSLSNGTIKSETEMKNAEISELRKEIEELKTVIKMLAVINSESITKAVRETIKEKGISPIMEDVDPYDMLLDLARAKDQELKREYNKMLAETNSFNHKK